MVEGVTTACATVLKDGGRTTALDSISLSETQQ